MKRTALQVQTWGKGSPGTIRVMVEDGESRVRAAVRSIERRLGLVCCGGPQDQGSSLSGGIETSHHYSITLGSKVPRKFGGGFSVHAQVWFAIQVA